MPRISSILKAVRASRHVWGQTTLEAKRAQNGGGQPQVLKDYTTLETPSQVLFSKLDEERLSPPRLWPPG
jgi:hypothetical protein